MATIAENLERIETAKEAIKDAIVAKGGAVQEDARIDEYPAAIEALPSGEGKESWLHFKFNRTNTLNIYNSPTATCRLLGLKYSFDDVNYIDASDQEQTIYIPYTANTDLFIKFDCVLYSDAPSTSYSDYGVFALSTASGEIIDVECKLNDYTQYTALFAPRNHFLFRINSVIELKVGNCNAIGGLFSGKFMNEYNIITKPINLNITGAYASLRTFYYCDFTQTEEPITIKITIPAVQSDICSYMFNKCKFKPTDRVELHIMKSNNQNYAFEYMFSSCTTLKNVDVVFDEILTTNMQGVYQYMFSNAGITKCPDLFKYANQFGQDMFLYAFHNTSITETPDIPSYKSISYNAFSSCFANCKQLTKTGFIYLSGNLSEYCSSMFNACSKLSETYWLSEVPPTIPSNIWTGCPEDMAIYVPDSAVDAYKAASVWSSRAEYIRGISEVVKGIELLEQDDLVVKSYSEYVYGINTKLRLTMNDDTTKDIDWVFDKVECGVNDTDTVVVKQVPVTLFGKTINIEITQTANDHQTITNVENYGTYGFDLKSNGYYESNNKGKGSSFAYATVTFVPQSDSVTFECINSGESSFDYGIISQLNKELAKSTSGDTSTTLVKKSFKGLSSLNPVDVVYDGLTGGETYTITVKFIKDSGGDQGNDSFQFRVKGE